MFDVCVGNTSLNWGEQVHQGGGCLLGTGWGILPIDLMYINMRDNTQALKRAVSILWCCK